ncbi:MAG: Cof-type HAD-IIB family hydrolase [Synechococcales bacterium]|nr:Cof-type HAD-IIB family hydrolase [Synechococcales bacterium]
MTSSMAESMQQNSLNEPLPSEVAYPTDAADIQLLVLDIDGTIAGQSNQIRPAVLQAIKAVQARGIQVAIATGRMYRSALRFHQAVNSPLPLMAYQGAFIKDPATDQLHRHWPVPVAIAHQLLDYFEQPDLRPLLSIHLYVDDQLYVRKMTPETQDYGKRTGIEPIVVKDLRQIAEREPTKILALSHSSDLINYLLSDLRQQYTPAELYFTKSVATFFEAANPQVNKGVAVRYLAEEVLKLRPENIMAIGDNFNDVEMLDYCGIGVAMGNAPPEVKTRANWIAPDVEEDGAAAAIEKFLLR